MEFVFLLVAFAGTLLATCRSLGSGLLAVIAVGYVNGLVRANFLGVASSFMFDLAVLGLYLGYYLGRSQRLKDAPLGVGWPLVLLLITWPIILSFIPVNHVLVQLVALRATVWLLPVLVLATRLTNSDLSLMSRGMSVLNLIAFVCGVYIFFYGVEALYPRNAVTRIIYASKDVAGFKYHRVPATFLNAHSYGGTMLLTLPFLMDRLVGVRIRVADRGLAAAGLIAAIGGLMMCGARMPLVQLAIALVVTWSLTHFSLKLGLVGAALVWGGAQVAFTSDRFQRSSSLEDTDFVTHRIASSANESFFELLAEYPLGAGMGSSVGTSVPFFLAHLAPQPVGMENEYSRILIDQGWLGLGGWLMFIVWLHARPPPSRPPAPWRLGVVFMYSLSLTIWATAFIGTGILSSIPATVLLLAQMGVLAVRARGTDPEAAGPTPKALAGVRR